MLPLRTARNSVDTIRVELREFGAVEQAVSAKLVESRLEKLGAQSRCSSARKGSQQTLDSPDNGECDTSCFS